jgi:hypothetical protein
MSDRDLSSLLLLYCTVSPDTEDGHGWLPIDAEWDQTGDWEDFGALADYASRVLDEWVLEYGDDSPDATTFGVAILLADEHGNSIGEPLAQVTRPNALPASPWAVGRQPCDRRPRASRGRPPRPEQGCVPSGRRDIPSATLAARVRRAWTVEA